MTVSWVRARRAFALLIGAVLVLTAPLGAAAAPVGVEADPEPQEPVAKAVATHEVRADGVVLELRSDANRSPLAVPGDWLVDVGGTFVTLPAALENGLVRDQGVTLTFTAPTTMDVEAAVRAAGFADPTVQVTTVEPRGSAPSHSVPRPAGARTITVLPVVWNGASQAATTDELRAAVAGAASWWTEWSGGRLRVRAQVADAVAVPDPGTCDAAVLHNIAVEAHGRSGARAAGEHLLVTTPWDRKCTWTERSALGGTVMWTSGAWMPRDVAHPFGHNLGLDDSTAPGSVMRGGSGAARHLDGALAWALGWADDVDGEGAGTVDATVRAGTSAHAARVVRLGAARDLVVSAGPQRQWTTESPSETLAHVSRLTVTDGIPAATFVGAIAGGQVLRVPDTGRAVGHTGAPTAAGAVPVRVVTTGSDTTPPSAPVVVPPRKGHLPYWASSIAWSPATDAGAGLAGYTVLVDGVAVSSVPAGTHSAPLGLIEPGRRTITVVATDFAGNETRSSAVVVTAANEELYLSMQAPAWDSTHPAGLVRLEWRTGLFGDEIAHLQVLLGDETVRVVRPSLGRLDLPMSPGREVVLLRAVGSDGTMLAEAGAIVDVTGVDPTLFHDMPPGSLLYGHVFWAAQRGITSGYPDGTFRPRQPITREAMAAFVFRYAQAEVSGFVPPATSPFRDVAPSHPFYREITWLHAQGITQGYSDGTFRGREPISRAATAAFLYRMAGATPATTDVPFLDITGHPFRTEITWMHARSITTGYPGHTFRPDQPVTREAMAAFLSRLHEIQG